MVGGKGVGLVEWLGWVELVTDWVDWIGLTDGDGKGDNTSLEPCRGDAVPLSFASESQEEQKEKVDDALSMWLRQVYAYGSLETRDEQTSTAYYRYEKKRN